MDFLCPATERNPNSSVDNVIETQVAKALADQVPIFDNTSTIFYILESQR